VKLQSYILFLTKKNHNLQFIIKKNVSLHLELIKLNFKFMAYKIDPNVCSACGSCIGECPIGAIVEGDVYSISVDDCINCGACSDVCPLEAISEE